MTPQLKHPKAYEVFTPREWKVFCLLLKGECHVNDFKKILNNGGEHNIANSVAVRIRAMRLKIHKHKLPYELKTSPWGRASYQLIQH